MQTTRAHPLAVTLALGLVVAARAGAQVDEPWKAPSPPLPKYSIPRPEVVALANGITLFLMEDHELPVIRVTARIRTGTLHDPAGKTGLADLASTVQRTGGTHSMSAEELESALEARAASIETQMLTSVGVAKMGCLKEDFDEIFKLFVEVLRFPRFAEDHIEIARLQATNEISGRNADADVVAARELERLVYGPESPLSRLPEHRTIAALRRQDLVDWHVGSHHPNNLLLGVVGDFDSATMKAKLARVFADWERGPEAAPPEIALREEPAPGVYLVDRDATQAVIWLGHLGLTRDDADYFAVLVLNEVLAGSAGRLYREIRSARGLAYSVYGGVGIDYRYPGVSRFGLRTRSAAAREAVGVLLAELRRMVAEPPGAEELAGAVEGLLNSLVFRFESKRAVLEQQMLLAYYGLPPDSLERIRAGIEAVTAEDVARVAREHLRPDEATLVVVGDAADLKRPLSAFGEVIELDVTIPPPADPSAASERADTAPGERPGASEGDRPWHPKETAHEP